ncbi:hypothetical protein NPA08_01260 [Mycoplasmopsis citelli]|uniref:Uncharacterized protein n=1 Tax=Mycoplasmopsis citelli TaxID=171281 RepID=A0A449B321_9BACT|nr:hypothetical protein [Mycoplasmopsis citelli]UUD36448.1 hypothetical protein NPA08_01260 [Mycoplasmopsis citelli]VEU74955.1 Uncharacterised protein [Mycoplasmopsis citelli]
MENKKLFSQKDKIKVNLTAELIAFKNTFKSILDQSLKGDYVDKPLFEKLNQCIENLHKLDQKIILSQWKHGEEKWYMNYFSRSTYYKKRKIAINNFLHCFINDRVSN